jgi:hypothetical protein
VGRILLYGTGIVLEGAIGYALLGLVPARLSLLPELVTHGLGVVTVGVIEKNGRPWI